MKPPGTGNAAGTAAQVMLKEQSTANGAHQGGTSSVKPPKAVKAEDKDKNGPRGGNHKTPRGALGHASYR